MSKVVEKNRQNRVCELEKILQKASNAMWDLNSCIEFCYDSDQGCDTEELQIVKYNAYSNHLRQIKVKTALDDIVSSCAVIKEAMEAADNETIFEEAR